MGNHLRVLEAAGELLAEIDRQKDELEQKQSEIDMLSEQLERKEAEMTSMCQQHQSETDDLQRQLLEARNEHLESERQHLAAEVHAKPMEIHNHFEPGSSSQVFNDQVSGKFTKNQNDKSVINKKRNDIKKNKKKWKKSIRKIL
jgi:chromosome segregation ATPase